MKRSRELELANDDNDDDDKVELNSIESIHSSSPIKKQKASKEEVELQAEKNRLLNTLKYQDHEEEQTQLIVSELREKSNALISKTIEKSKKRKSKREEIRKGKRILRSDSDRIRELEENINSVPRINNASKQVNNVTQSSPDQMEKANNEGVLESAIGGQIVNKDDNMENDEEFESVMPDQENEEDVFNYEIAENKEEKKDSFIIETEVPIEEENQKTTKSIEKRFLIKRKTKEEKQIDLEIYKMYVLVFFAYNLRRNTLADSPLVQGLLLSMIPDHIHTMMNVENNNIEEQGNHKQRKSKQKAKSKLGIKKTTNDIILVQNLVKWFQETFEIITPDVEDEDYRKTGVSQINNMVFQITEQSLIDSIRKKKLLDIEYFIIFLSMFRCLGISCRQICVIDPEVLLKQGEKNKSNENSKGSTSKDNKSGTSNWTKKSNKQESEEDKQSDEEGELKEYIKEKKKKSPIKAQSSETSSIENVCHNDIWIEMYSPVQKSWIRIEHDLIEQKKLTQSIMNSFMFKKSVDNLPNHKDRKNTPTKVCGFPCFVLAFGKENAYIKDITFNHFITRPKETISGHQQFDESQEWLRKLLAIYNNNELYETLLEFERQLIENEQERFKEIRDELLKQLPKSQDAYKAHPLYCIEKWITRYEALYPPNPPALGKCGKYNVYNRSFIHTLHTKDRWLREGRQLLPDERPYKIVKASQLSSGANCELYGEWQTKGYVTPIAKDGMVPKNERGQVDLWHERMVPEGTVHINVRGMAQVARKLKIDYAPAMTGFEVRGRRSVPKIEGIVVCREYEDILKDAYVQHQQLRLERIKKRKEMRIRKNWRRLVLKLLAREDIKSRFGHLLREETAQNNEEQQQNEQVESCSTESISHSTYTSNLSEDEDMMEDTEEEEKEMEAI